MIGYFYIVFVMLIVLLSMSYVNIELGELLVLALMVKLKIYELSYVLLLNGEMIGSFCL